ncbi:MAG TPA: VWA domain-containing protein [Acidobacteriota bacterium]|nr:VWA domain-containing protein [Acidobacteriota bacterium]
MKFDVRSDRALIREAGGSRRYCLVSFTAPVVPPKADRKPINVTFVLDRSGSMGGERKIELVREAVDKAIGMLREDDRFSVVIYDDRIDVLMESTLASGEAKRAARRQLERVTARGSTNLGGGWLRGCEQAAIHFNNAVPTKCLLLTDGLANQGITDQSELARHADELRQRGVLTSTFGVGSDFDEVLLQKMADAGGGHSYYVQKAVQIADFLTSELGETLEVVARQATLQFILPTGVEAEPLNSFRFKRSDNDLSIDLGSLVSGQEVSIVVGLRFSKGNIGDTLSAGVCLTDRDGEMTPVATSLNWTFADHAANDKQARDRVVDAAVAELYAAKARDEALACNRRGDFNGARTVMSKTADRIREYAGDSKSIQNLADVLAQEAVEYQEVMPVAEMKFRYYSAQHAMRSRDAQGKSKRSKN